MGKQYNISELIDGYTDNDFLIEGESGADSEAVLNGVMARVKPKKRLRLGIKLLMAAALAATVTITAATATASSPVRVYTRADGSVLTVGSKECPVIDNGANSSDDNIYVIENDRVYFTFDGQHLDITDLIDYDTPYCYRSDITDSLGEVHERWIAVGGTPRYLGWAEAIVDFNGEGFPFFGGYGNVWYDQYYIDGEILTDLGKDSAYEYVNLYPYRSHYFGWFEEFHNKFHTPSREYYDAELEWHYPHDWQGESVDGNIPFPDDLSQFE